MLSGPKPDIPIEKPNVPQRKMEHTRNNIDDEAITDVIQLGEFYILVTDFEKQLRQFIKGKFGKGFHKRMKNEIPKVYDKWVERKESDEYWGIEAEKDLFNYALFTDYLMIIKKFMKIFVNSDEELGYIHANLGMLTNQGRNPLMHCRTLTPQKYYSAKSCVDYLNKWMQRQNTSG